MKYGAVPSRSEENCWHVGDMENFQSIARFYGADAEKDAKEYVEKKNKEKYDEHMEKHFPNKVLKNLIGSGTLEDDQSERWLNWYLFHSESIQEVVDNMERAGYNLDGDENNYSYSPTGKSFNGKAEIIDLDGFILVKQTGYVDC